MDMLATAKSKKYPTSLETYVGTDKKVTVKTAQEIADMLKERLGEARSASTRPACRSSPRRTYS